mmetsp:Transcript_23036/g.63626  ORF Transcript_23036/g.63626 Transcript_23036/m.63626 type:complete len:232 (-) Transcript_23036:175-870(-)
MPMFSRVSTMSSSTAAQAPVARLCAYGASSTGCSGGKPPSRCLPGTHCSRRSSTNSVSKPHIKLRPYSSLRATSARRRAARGQPDQEGKVGGERAPCCRPIRGDGWVHMSARTMQCPGAQGRSTTGLAGTNRISPTGSRPLLGAMQSLYAGWAMQAEVSPSPVVPMLLNRCHGTTLHLRSPLLSHNSTRTLLRASSAGVESLDASDSCCSRFSSMYLSSAKEVSSEILLSN